MRYPIDNKVVLITGATGGIGAAMAKALHVRGASLVLTSRHQPALDELARELGEGRTLAISSDVTDRRSIDAVVKAAASRFGGLDVVIANAGGAVDPPATVATVDEQEFERVIDVDLLGVWRTVRGALPEIIARRGHVVVTASVYSYVNGVVNAAYAASKAGVEQFARALRAELAPHGATAGVLYPGWTMTPLIKPGFGGNAVASEMLRHAYPRFLRTPITPDVVAAAAIRGIEQRSPRVTVPGRWGAYSVLRGILNPLTDWAIERDPKMRRLILELERQATDRGNRTADHAQSRRSARAKTERPPA
jgi:NAD(P)-dependent dehydrogenase (short-subunit alcohol dehydrogenase family)